MIAAVEKGKGAKASVQRKYLMARSRPNIFQFYPCKVKKAGSLLEQWVVSCYLPA